MKIKPEYKTWIELERRALRHNIEIFRSILKKRTKLFAVVKSNAYGHGLIDFSKIADEFGVEGFCVDSVIEGLKLRDASIKKPILVLGPSSTREQLKEAGIADIILTISNLDALKTLLRNKLAPDFHLKIDTGMHRQGFYLADLLIALRLIRSSKLKSRLKGIYTHFAAAKDITYPDYTLRQLDKFKNAADLCRKAGFKDLIYHTAATGGTTLHHQTHFDMVRVGIGLYGYWPTKEIETQHSLIWKRKLLLKPVLSWRAIISEVKKFNPGDFIGYDLTEKVLTKTTGAIIPIGYWHGFPRTLSSIGLVLIDGQFAKVMGRVSMDLITVGLPHGLKIKAGAIATLIGKDGKKEISAQKLAELEKTSHYEAITRLNPLIKKIVV